MCPRKPVFAQGHKKRAGVIFDEVDKDADGELTSDEFAEWAEDNPEKATVFFAFLDAAFWLQYGDGKETGQDAPLADKAGEFWKKVSKDFDENGDGKLNKAEFCVLYSRLTNADSSLYDTPAPVDKGGDSGSKTPPGSTNKSNSSSAVKSKDKKVKKLVSAKKPKDTKDKKWFKDTKWVCWLIILSQKI